MDAAMDVGVVVLVVVLSASRTARGFCVGGGVVEIDQRLAVDLLLQDRKVVADARRRRTPAAMRFGAMRRRDFRSLVIAAAGSCVLLCRQAT